MGSARSRPLMGTFQAIATLNKRRWFRKVEAMMRRAGWGSLIGIVITLCVARAAMGLGTGDRLTSPSVPEQAYRWEVHPDGTSEIWKDSGDHMWTSLGVFPVPVQEVIVHPAQPSLVFVRARSTLYRSEDAGAHWEILSELPDIPTTLAPAQYTRGLVYLGTLTGGVYRSVDGGRTWARLSPTLGLLPGTILEVTALAVAPQDDELIYVATGYWLGTVQMRFAPVGIFVSVDGGETWLPLHRAMPSEPRVIRLIPDGEHTLTVQAVTGLAASWYTFGDTVLLDEWLSADKPSRRAAAAKAWGWIGGRDGATRLLQRLSLEPDPAVGQAIARALGPLATPEMVPALIAALGHDDPQVRWRAATVLGYLPTAASIEALGQTLRNDESIARQAAAQALARIGTVEAAREVLSLLGESDWAPARHLALATLEQIGEPAVDPLVAVLATADRPAVRRGAAEALGWIRSPRATAALAAALHDPSEAVRLEAVRALAEIDTLQAREALATASHDPSYLVRGYAIAALGEKGASFATMDAPLGTWPALPDLFPDWLGWLRWAVLVMTVIIVAVIVLGGNGRSRLFPRR